VGHRHLEPTALAIWPNRSRCSLVGPTKKRKPYRPGQQVHRHPRLRPADDGVPYRPPVRPPTKDEAEDEADAQIRTLAGRFKKDWPLFAALGVGAYFIVASGIFR